MLSLRCYLLKGCQKHICGWNFGFEVEVDHEKAVHYFGSIDFD
jgi:hypothetical protein